MYSKVEKLTCLIITFNDKKKKIAMPYYIKKFFSENYLYLSYIIYLILSLSISS